MDVKRPGVYIEEVSLLPPSVVGVSTAVPAFLGYTQKQVDTPQKITSLLEFTDVFGAPNGEFFTALPDGAGAWQVARNPGENFLLYYLLKMFFNNGGKVCYVISVGTFGAGKSKQDFLDALPALKKEDEPTLIVLGDAVTLGWTAYKDIAQQALMQCGELKDRFTILDVLEGDEEGTQFRGLSSSFLKYGAAYTPFLKTSLNYELDEDFASRVTVNEGTIHHDTHENGLRIRYSGDRNNAAVKIEAGTGFSINKDANDPTKLVINGVDGAKAADIFSMWQDQSTDIAPFELYQVGEGEGRIPAVAAQDLEAMKVHRILNDNDEDDVVLLFCYTGTGNSNVTPKLTLTLNQDDWNFSYDPSTHVFTIDVRGEEVVASDLLNAYTEVSGFHLLPVGEGVITQDIEADLTPVQGYRMPDTADGLMVLYEPTSDEVAQVEVLAPTLSFTIGPPNYDLLTISGVGPGISPATVITQWEAALGADPPLEPYGYELLILHSGDEPVVAQETTWLGLPSLEDIKGTDKYNQIKAKLNEIYLTLPPSGAVAGVYSLVDQERGVWKAPANVPLMSVIGPAVKITDLEHDALNLDPIGGKSINAIRNYTGRGTLIMGARTLAGNDNEWRYIPVRRLFNMIEESTKKATEVFVFEPNNATTWTKVKGMIESYLFGLWQRGALAGPTPEAAYFVNVGLGKTMTQQNILEGKMIVEIGIAAVRPAEFIILRFSHKMQEAA